MKQKIMISAGTQCFEFDGEITEIENDYIVLKAKHGDIYIERKYLVFIQYLNDKDDEEELISPEMPKAPKVDAAAKFINKRLRHDPVDKILEEKFVPPSQLPDDNYDEDYEATVQAERLYGKPHPITQPENLADAIKVTMRGGSEDLSMSFGGAGKHHNPLQTILGMKNASNKKS